jgi:hypothetical protein
MGSVFSFTGLLKVDLAVDPDLVAYASGCLRRHAANCRQQVVSGGWVCFPGIMFWCLEAVLRAAAAALYVPAVEASAGKYCSSVPFMNAAWPNALLCCTHTAAVTKHLGGTYGQNVSDCFFVQ